MPKNKHSKMSNKQQQQEEEDQKPEMTCPDIYGQEHPIETKDLIQASLEEFEKEVEKLPAEAKVNLNLAKERCPQVLTDAFKLKFLRCEVFRVKDAAKRYAKFWDTWRYVCESDEAAFDSRGPFGLDSLAFREDSVAFSMGLCQLMPYKDPSGRSIIFMDSSRQDHKNLTIKSQARAAAYTILAALEEESTQQHGIIIIFWPYKERWDQPNREFLSLLASSVKGALPVRLSAIHVCQHKPIFNLLIPLVKFFMGQRLRKRLRFHGGSNEQVRTALAPYGLTKDVLPIELGGDVELHQEKWLAARKQAGK